MAFITNQQKEGATTLKKRLTELTTHADKLDMLVGFFYFSGVKVMAEAFRDRPNMTLRVLVGMEADLHLGELVEISRESKGASNETIKERFRESLKKIVGSDFADKQAFHERLEIFIGLLESGRLEIKKTRDPNHAKLYIFELDESQVGSRKYWITGSSNFSEPGLMRRDELNVQIGDFGHKEVQEYFDDLWEDAVPLAATDEDRAVIIKILKTASVAADITPFEAYFLVLQNYIEHQQTKLKELQVDNILEEAGFKKYRYQVDAVAQACARLDAYGGIIIADVVGLGKSIIGGLIGALRAKRGLIICPPGLMGDPKGDAGGWYEYRDKFKLHGWEIWSRGKLEDLEDKLKHDNAFDMVIVDEAHNFRNERTEDYERLANICFGKETVLLTAMPYNNRPGDLLALLRLFTSLKKSPLVAGGDLELKFSIFIARFRSIASLRRTLAYRKKHPEEAKRLQKEIDKLLKDCGIEGLKCDFGHDEKKTFAEIERVSQRLSKQIRQIMEKIVIRRNRLDLLNDPDYKKEIDSLSTVQDPKEQFFELTDEQNAFYDKVINDYFGDRGAFHGAIYHPQAYLKSKEGTDEAQENLYHMLLSSLVQRFESSFGAFRKSIESVKRSLEISLAFVEKMHVFLYSRKAMEQILLLDTNEEREEAMIAAIVEQQEKYEKKGVKTKNAISYNITGGDFNGKRFVEHIKADIALLGKILEEVSGLKLESKDPKAASLVRAIGKVLDGTHPAIAAEPDAPKRKILVFSTFTDTIRHIGKLVEKKFPGRVISVTGANFGKERALEVKRNFDASFEEQVDDFDILLATDKLSEGFNLNRAGVVVNYDIPWNPTRVIQRVGRINRIGKKVFDSLYIFNFFPTKKGDEIVANRQIAESKMFAIHKILGEDSKMFSITEEPTAAKLYDKLSHFGEEEDISFYTSAKKKYLAARCSLEKHDPEAFERIKGFPNNVKTAWNGNPKETVLLRRCGPSFFALAYGGDTGVIEEIALEDAITRLECDWDTPRVAFSGEFWRLPNLDDPKHPKDGIYAMLKNYRPTGAAKGGAGHLSESAQAIAAIAAIKGELPEALQKFAGDVAEDIQNYGSVPAQTVKKIKEAGNIKKKDDRIAELSGILANLLDVRGADYLAKLKKRYDGEAVIVTVEKCGQDHPSDMRGRSGE